MDNAPVRAIFNRIAPAYDELNDWLSLGQHRVWKKLAVKWSGAQSGDRCLDVCCGSGDLTLLLAQQVAPKGQVVGVDFAPAQLAIAQHRSYDRCIDPWVTWVEGDALALPFSTDEFDAATMGYGLRNVTNPRQALAELQRVLKPGATVAILDFHRPESKALQLLQTWYLQNLVVPTAQSYGLGAEYAYIQASLDQFLTGPEQVTLAQQVGFATAIHYPLVGGMMGVLCATTRG